MGCSNLCRRNFSSSITKPGAWAAETGTAEFVVDCAAVIRAGAEGQGAMNASKAMVKRMETFFTVTSTIRDISFCDTAITTLELLNPVFRAGHSLSDGDGESIPYFGKPNGIPLERDGTRRERRCLFSDERPSSARQTNFET